MNVCVFGAGNMGARIAEVFLTAGHTVTMLDIKDQFLERGVNTIKNDFAFLVKKGKMEQEKADELLGTLLWLTDEKASGFVTGVIIPVDGGFSAYSGV